MELDALQQRWMEQDVRMDRMLRINRKVLDVLERGHARSALHRFGFALAGQFAIDLLAVIALGVFVGNHFAEPRFLLPALLLQIAATGVLLSVVRQAVLLGRIDPGGPVMGMQMRVESLTVFRVRVTKGVVISAMALWLPLYIVGLKGLFGLDLYTLLPSSFLVTNAVVGALCIPVTLWLSRRYAAKVGAHPAMQKLARDLAGVTLNAARDQIGKLAAFEREDDTTA